MPDWRVSPPALITAIRKAAATIPSGSPPEIQLTRKPTKP